MYHHSSFKFCLVTQPDNQSMDDYALFIRQAVQGGVTMVQLRTKSNPAALLDTAKQLLSILRPLSIPLIINDNVDVAKEIDADGVHLGQSDLSPEEARKILGPDKIIGWSIETLEQLDKANTLNCIDYVAASAVFPSTTKTNCKTIWGLSGLKSLTQRSHHPVMAIGGINITNVRNVMAHGACGVAVVSAIHTHVNPELAAAAIFQEMMKSSNANNLNLRPKITALITKIQTIKPLILNMSNHVTMDFIANGLLALGASPIMCLATQEVEDLLTISHCAIINIGTLNDTFISLCEKTCEIANQLNKPLILDPVGAGASAYRTQTCLQLLKKFKFSIIRGNASEIISLAGTIAYTKGVDSSDDTLHAIAAAKLLSIHYNTTVAISGCTDAIVHKEHVSLLHYGSALMPKITGSGCLLTAVVGAFAAVHQNNAEAALAAIAFYGLCGELAAQQANGPGTFKPYFLDALARLPEVDCYVQN